MSPLDTAEYRNHKGAVRALLTFGADVALATRKGQRARDLAAGNLRVLLESYERTGILDIDGY